VNGKRRLVRTALAVLANALFTIVGDKAAKG
jgi:hypothetical protein